MGRHGKELQENEMIHYPAQVLFLGGGCAVRIPAFLLSCKRAATVEKKEEEFCDEVDSVEGEKKKSSRRSNRT